MLLCGDDGGTDWENLAALAGVAPAALVVAVESPAPASAEAAEAEPNDTAATTTPITIGPTAPTAVVTAAITTRDVDFYSFALTERFGVFFDVDSRDVALSTNLNSVLTLFNAAGTTSLGSNDDGYDFDTFALNDTSATPPSPDASLYLDLEPGTYAVKVSAVSGTGSYRLTVRADSTYTTTVPVFNSNPSAADTLLLDFDGHASSTDFHAAVRDIDKVKPGVQLNGPYSIPAFDFNGNPGEFTPAERLAIETVWRVVAEDYSPFNVNVTTSYDGPFDDGVAFRQVIGNAVGTEVGFGTDAIGAARPRSYTIDGDGDNVGYTFADGFAYILGAAGISAQTGSKAVEMGNTASHEFGHGLGLRHFGGSNPQPNGIMHQPNFGLNRERWRAGNTHSDEPPVTQQDDLAVIGGATNTFGYRPDDYGDGLETATELAPFGGGANCAARGIIGRTSDRDVFRFTAPAAGATTVRVGLAFEQIANLDAELRLYDAAGALVASHDPSNSVYASLVRRLQPGGVYYAEVRSDGQAGEVGQYDLTVTNTGAIGGAVFEDSDGDGTRGGAEPALAGVRVYLDADNDAALDAGEASATTDALGRYEFTDVAAGRHVVRQVTPPAHEQVFPGQGGPTVGGTIEGINYNEDGGNNGSNNIPPDPIGAVGPGHVVSVVNTSIEWHTKAGQQQRSQSLRSFFSRLSPLTDTNDPKVIYDQYAGRFVVLTLERTSIAEGGAADTSRIFLAVSDDADPNGNWRFAAINSKLRIDGRERWADFPGLAVDEEAVYLTANMVTYAPGLAPPSRLWIIAKEGLYDAASAVAQPAVTVHDPAAAAGLPPEPYVSFTAQPAHVFGEAPAGAGTFLVTVGPGGNELRAVRVDNPLSPSPAFTYQAIQLGELGDIPHSFILPGAPQRGGARSVFTGPGHIRNAVWRGGALWATMTVLPTSGPDAGQTTVHWVKVDTSDLSQLRLAEQGNVGGEELGPGTFTYYSSIAVDGQGNMAIGFSASSASVCAGAYVAGRRADDPPGTVRPAAAIALGQDYYFRTFGGERNRWGDYSGTVVDPADDSTFWSFNEYALTRDSGGGSETGRWGTRWGRFTLPDVSPGGHRVDLADGQSAAGLNFGSRRTTGSVRGTLFGDSDGDGAQNDNEAGLPGRTVYLDLNRNGRLDDAGSATATAAAVEVPRATVDAGVAFDGRLSAYLSSNVPGTITDVNVRLSITHPRISDLEVALVSQAGTRVPLVARVGGTRGNFGNTILDDEAATSIDAGIAPFNGSFRPQSALATFDGQQAAGTWRLEVRDVAAGSTGTVTGWSLVFTTSRPGEPAAVTSDTGAYSFAGLPLGNYVVRQILPEDWEQTAPADNAAHALTLTAAAPDAPGRDFGARTTAPPPAEVVGRFVFYNDSFYDGGDPAANAADDTAIATDKAALLPGQVPSFANVTSYDEGINGVMVDIANLPQDVTLVSADFDFNGAPAPTSVSVRRGAGVNGSDRVTIIWQDDDPLAGPNSVAAANGWIRVTLQANANTGLAQADVFSFGNVIGETGDGTGSTGWRVSALDLAAVKRALNTDATVTSATDFDRDGRTNALDLAIARRSLNQPLPLPPARVFAALVPPPSAEPLPVGRVAEDVL